MVLVPTNLEETIDEAFRYRQRQLEIKIKAEILLQKLVGTKEDTSSDTINTHNANSHRLNFLGNARLPKLELPKFGGNYLEFNSFFDKFLAIVDKSELPAVTKFTYLQSLLTGEALASIKGLSVTDESYPAAKDILLQRYGRKERVIFAHIQKL
ncbi:Duf1759 and peptidase a17 and duf1758 and rvt 1 d omain containing protein [Plakobranchus ocellatus]|uniref:Duf1759 and peptidase a17 and duf1758 and rvt 1 d omain containing protein n=1 Tax=Plakobranchus ocellatus TaxID=259542 RepID=A0AAV4CA08_9GAST|nr:Duf1759 and peptidase a17 and duf1758 and rvt 1 d omain containing protein [Plakobranchus ocellatus]